MVSLVWTNALTVITFCLYLHFHAHEWCVIPFHIQVTLSLFSFPLMMPSSVLPGCHVFCFFCYHQRDKWGARELKPLGLCPRIITTPFICPRPLPPARPPPPHLSVFLSDSWQPVGYSGHANPSVQIFANWLEKIHIWTWLTHTCCNSVSPIAVLFWAAWTHYCLRSFVAIKTCNSVSTECLLMNPVGRTRGRGCAGSRYKINRWKQQRWS